MESRDTGTPLLMAVVNVGEVWYSLARGYSEAVADAKISELLSLGVEVIDADWEVTRQAAIYKAKGSIAYADCFAAALARQRSAALVTGDAEFKQLEREVEILWL